MQDKRIETLLGLLSGSANTNERAVQENMVNSLSDEQKALFQKALADRDTANKLLQSPQAVAILKKLQGNGGQNGSE